jgi:hypothetical protein
MSARDLFIAQAGDHCTVPALIAVFRWHECCRPGCYLVHVQPGPLCTGLLSDSGVFRAGELMRHAVVNDFGDLVRVVPS